MRTFFLFFVVSIITASCIGQDRPVTVKLQQIEFKDKELNKTLMNLTKNDSRCFDKKDVYILDFFQSSLTDDEYYLTVNWFIPTLEKLELIAYYVVVDDITYLISKKVSHDILKILPTSKNFSFYIINEPFPCADYNFLIWKTPVGDYDVLLNYCSE